jgi:CubicO group peptidase (beta-lactamase class C family)
VILHEYLERITPFGFSGACLVGLGDDIVLNAGYGFAVRADRLPNTADTVFSLGAVTKQFTAAAILKLEERGALATGDPIERFVDDVPADKADITLHHLLTHTSGLVMDTGDDYEPAERDAIVAKMLEAPLRFPPGADHAYSNAGYSLLAAIVEFAAGEAYEDFLHREVLRPAGLEATGYRLPNWSEPVVAHWYAPDSVNVTPLEKPYPLWNLLGNGEMLSTTEDMFRWHRALLGDAVLSAGSRRKLFTPYAGDYAYGWTYYSAANGNLRIEQHMPIEGYVRGINEVPFGWANSGGANALQAQAIAARTFMLKEGAGGATPAFQVYEGYTTESSELGNLWRQAVDATASRVVTTGAANPSSRSELAFSVYSSSHGGRTERSSDSWAYRDQFPYLTSVNDPWSLSAPGNAVTLRCRSASSASRSTIARLLPEMLRVPPAPTPVLRAVSAMAAMTSGWRPMPR